MITDIPWSQDDAGFRRELEAGFSWQSVVLAYLRARGLPAEMPALSFRENIDDAERWRQTYDIGVGRLQLEVKSRPFAFTNPNDWPSNRSPAFLDVTKKWSAKLVKPFAYVFVSRVTGAMLATCATESAAARWGRVMKRDSVRGIEDEFFTVETKRLVPMGVLVEAIERELKATQQD